MLPRWEQSRKKPGREHLPQSPDQATHMENTMLLPTVSTTRPLCQHCFGRRYVLDIDGGLRNCPDCQAHMRGQPLPPCDVWVVWSADTEHESCECLGRSHTLTEARQIAKRFLDDCSAKVASGEVPPWWFDEMTVRVDDGSGDPEERVLADWCDVAEAA